MKICQNCGAEVSDTAKFCRKCGARLEAEEAQGAQRAAEDISGVADEDVTEDIAGRVADTAAEAPAEAPAEEDLQEDRFTAEQAAAAQPFGMGAGTAEFIGQDYQWGPPTGGEDYDEPAMPAVFVRDAEEGQEKPDSGGKPEYTYQIDAPDFDHTEEFDPGDISDNKVTAMAAYLLGPLGVIIALLAGKDSPYADFHMRQGLKFVVVEALLSIIAILLCWTLIVPAACLVILLILWVIKIITIISVCRGKAKEPAMIRSMRFLK